MPKPKDKKSPSYMRDADKRALLKSTDLFGPLGTRHIERLAACVVSKSVARATAICAKGDLGTSLFVICHGTVRITAPSVDGHDALFNLFGKGAILGRLPCSTAGHGRRTPSPSPTASCLSSSGGISSPSCGRSLRLRSG